MLIQCAAAKEEKPSLRHPPMVDEAQKKQALDRIRENITRKGHHIYSVAGGGAIPRFAYTIGVSDSTGFELILAGAIFYYLNDVTQIINDMVAKLKTRNDQDVFEVTGQGSFSLRKAHVSWARSLMLGAMDYYRVDELPALQIVPDKSHWTIDVPDMSTPWSATTEPVWRWLHEPWTFPVPEASTATTNLTALRGGRITEAMRWEEDEWELFAGAGPDVTEDERRVVPLGTLLGVDESLRGVVSLEIGTGLWRDGVSDWHAWGQSLRR